MHHMCLILIIFFQNFLTWGRSTNSFSKPSQCQQLNARLCSSDPPDNNIVFMVVIFVIIIIPHSDWWVTSWRTSVWGIGTATAWVARVRTLPTFGNPTWTRPIFRSKVFTTAWTLLSFQPCFGGLHPGPIGDGRLFIYTTDFCDVTKLWRLALRQWIILVCCCAWVHSGSDVCHAWCLDNFESFSWDCYWWFE